jgi:hypothetical protein
MHDELQRQIAELVVDHADQATPPPIAAIRRRGRRRRARLGERWLARRLAVHL